MGSQGDEAPVCLVGRGAFPPECCGGPTGYRLMLKRQQKGESMGTPAQVESVISLMTAAHPDTPQSSWELLRDVMDDGMRSLDQRLEHYGPLEPHRFSVKEANQRLARLALVSVVPSPRERGVTLGLLLFSLLCDGNLSQN